jgi:hypothetical protein
VNAIRSQDLSFCCDKRFNCGQIDGLEELILSTLNCKLALPTIYDFCHAFIDNLGVDANSIEYWTLRYFADLALRSSSSIFFGPGMVAASVVVLARYCLGKADLWPSAVQEKTGFTLQQLESCILRLSRLNAEISVSLPGLLIIERAYRRSDRCEVANLPFPIVHSLDTLVQYQSAQRQGTP